MKKKLFIICGIIALVICLVFCLYDDGLYGMIGKKRGVWISKEKIIWLIPSGKDTYHASGCIVIEGEVIKIEAIEKRNFKKGNDIIKIKSAKTDSEAEESIYFELFGNFSTSEIFNGRVQNSEGNIDDGEQIMLIKVTEEEFRDWLKEKKMNVIDNTLNAEKGVIYRDSLGRTVEITEKIHRVVPTGIFAQTVLEILCPEKLASLAKSIENEKNIYEKSQKSFLCDLPVIGVMDMSESISKKIIGYDAKIIKTINADVIIDIGTAKENLGEKLSDIQYITDIPTLYIDATVGNLASSFLFLGQLLNCEERAKKIVAYIDKLYSDLYAKKKNIESDVSVFYAANEMGMHGKTEYSFQNEIIDMLGYKNVRNISVDGQNRTTALCIRNMTAEIIIFNNWECYEELARNQGDAYELWKDTHAIRQGMYGVSPGLFHSWVGSPVLVQLIGAVWLGNFVNPSVFDYDMNEFVREFYDLFYDYSISAEESEKILNGNIRKDDFIVGRNVENQLLEKLQSLENNATYIEVLL